jgi:hypothetical protein
VGGVDGGAGGLVYGMWLEGDCNDSQDNDGDGRIDCADEDCADECAPGTGGTSGVGGVDGGGIAGAYGVPFENCGDGLDNDSDNLVDCADSDCASACSPGTGGAATGGAGGSGAIPATGGMGGTVYGIPLEYSCNNGVSDDLDGLVDCDDPDCANSTYCTTGIGGTAAGGTAGAGNVMIGGSGGLAAEYGIPYEADCTDQIDNDGDTLIDCNDPDCSGNASCNINLYGIPF